MSENKIYETIQKAKSDSIVKRYLFNKLKDVEDPIKWLDILIKLDMYNPKHNPQPLIDDQGYIRTPAWDELLYLEHICANKNLTIEVIEKVLQIINNIITFKIENGTRIENIRTDWLIIKILSQIPDYITTEHINYIGKALKSKMDNSIISGEINNNLLPKLLEIGDKNIIITLMKVIFDYKIVEYTISESHTFKDVKPIMGDFWFSQLIADNKSKIFDICGIDLLEVCENIIIEAIRKEDSSFTVITIEESNQNLVESYETIMIHFIRDLFLHHKPHEIKDIIARYFIHKILIFNRIALHIISIYYDELNSVFWKINYNPLLNYDIKHELWELFKKNAKIFDEKQISIILDWIEHEEYYVPIEVEKGLMTQDEVWALKKKEWLLSIMDSEIKEIHSRYEKYNSIYPIDVEHPGYLVWSEGVVSVPHSKPFEESLLERTNDEIVEYLNKLKPTDKLTLLRSMEPRQSFKLTVQDHSEKFVSDTLSMKDLKPEYFYEYIFGLYEAWKAGATFSWDEVFPLLLDIANDESFWVMEGEYNQYKNRIIQRISDLIGEGCRDEDHSFNPSEMEKAAEILLKMDERCDFKITYNEKIMDYVINSPRGSIYEAMLRYSIRYSKINDIEWVNNIKSRFDELLSDPAKASFELYFYIGRYLAHLYYLDKEWVHKNLDNIFIKTQEQIWSSTFIGYLSGYRTSNKELYLLLRESNNYKKGLDSDIEGMFETVLISHIGIAYFNEIEKLDDESGLLRYMIEKCKKSHISSLILYIFRSRDQLEQKHKDMIIILWNRIVEKLLEDVTNDSKELLSTLVYWFKLIDHIDDNSLKLMKTSAKYVNQGYSSIELIDSLSRLADTQAKQSGEIFLESLHSEELPFIREKKIIELLDKIYESGELKIAEKIYTIYMQKGFFFVQQSYDKYN